MHVLGGFAVLILVSSSACTDQSNSEDNTNSRASESSDDAGTEGNAGEPQPSVADDGSTDQPEPTEEPSNSAEPGAAANEPESEPTALAPAPDANEPEVSEPEPTEAEPNVAPSPSAEAPTDGGTPADAEPSPEVPTQPDGTVPAFVAVGHAGRTVLSCDGGNSWIADRSDAPERRCFDDQGDNFDCDHSSDAGTGVAYGNGWFVATFGWGAPGSIRRSRDGIEREVVAEGTEEDTMTSSGLAFGNNLFLTGARSPRSAGPDADVWLRATELPLDIWNVRKTAFISAQGGTFINFAQDGDTSQLVYGTDGSDWQLSDSGGEHCGGQNIVHGGGVTLMLGDAGCRSTDGGRVWTPVSLPSAARTPTVWDGEQFMYWGQDDDYNDARYTSADGLEWTETAATASDGERMRLGAVARAADGTLVSVRGEWQQWYETQRFYHSQDGVTWDVVPEGQYTGSHPIRQMVFGYLQPSELCPLP